ncbi:hypothetical protein M4J06_000388 [Streptomyces coelicoflavus]|uniref:hypothetical protein n=1 Tax=Streptomyces TaxID=1883 RepID=UPI0021086221|nr:hypothetical protein [Streptomyces coelicoflavus]MCQ4203086.1 hypothetical protein [Streptomyces coelicoflavus]
MIMIAAFKCIEEMDTLRTRTHQASRLLLARRYAIVSLCAKAINACALARRGGEQRAERVRLLSRRLKAVRRALLDAHRSRGTIARYSHRARRVKLHERKVAAALEEIEARIDQAPNEALSEIATELLTIADRYCEGRVGALMDEERLADITVHRKREVLRLLIAFVLAIVGITGLARTGVVPNGAESLVYLLTFATALLLTFGRNFRRQLDVFAVVTGGP